MSEILNKSQMTEEDIKLRYITPAITAKWDVKKISMETRLTDGKVNINGNLVFREKPKRADYLLYLNPNNPIAVVEAKDNNHSVSFGLQQAMMYARMLDLPFAFSSNGDGFAEHDFLTGEEREFGMDEFPLRNRIDRAFPVRISADTGAENGDRPALLYQPEHLSPTLLSAHCH